VIIGRENTGHLEQSLCIRSPAKEVRKLNFVLVLRLLRRKHGYILPSFIGQKHKDLLPPSPVVLVFTDWV